MVFVILIIFCSLGYSAAVTDLNLFVVDTPPFSTGQDINFGVSWTGGDVNYLYWSFAEDGNVVDSSASTVFSDTFSDGDYTGWTVQAGAWEVDTQRLRNTSNDSKISVPYTVDLTADYYEWQMVYDANTDGSNFIIVVGTGSNWNLNSDPSYHVYIDTAGKPYFRYGDGAGSSTVLISGSNGDLVKGVPSTIKITRQTDGNFSMYVDDVYKGSDLNTSITTPTSFWLDHRVMRTALSSVLILSGSGTVISSPYYRTHSFSSAGEKNLQISAETDVNASAELDVAIAGAMNFQIWDENLGVTIPGATLTFNGTEYTAGADGNISIPLSGISNGDYTLTLDHNSDYTSRTFVYDLNQLSSIDQNLMLLQTKHGLALDFLFYAPDESTVLSNAYIDFNRSDKVNDGLASKIKTNSSGEATVFLNADSNYLLYVESSGGTIYYYYPTQVTVYPPKKESDGSTITPINFDVSVAGLAQQSFYDQGASVTFSIFSNTSSYYDVTVDVNQSEYFERKYNIRTYGNPLTYTLQPYLTDATDGTSIKLTTRRKVDLSSIGGVRVIIYKYISGEGRALIEDVVTDDKGEAYTSGIVNSSYEYEVYYNNNLVDNFDIVVTSTEIYITFDPSSVTPISGNTYVDVSFDPIYSAIHNLSASTILSQTVFWLNNDVNAITIYAKEVDVNQQIMDYNLYRVVVSSVTNGYTNEITVGTDLSSWDTNLTLMIFVEVKFTDGSTFLKRHAYIYPYGTSGQTFTGLKEDVFEALGCEGENCVFLTLIALFFSIAAAGTLYTMNPFPEMQGTASLIFLFALGVFMLIGWVHWALWLVSAIAIVAVLTLGKRVM